MDAAPRAQLGGVEVARRVAIEAAEDAQQRAGERSRSPDSGAAAPKEPSEPASEKEPLVASGEDAAAAFRGAVAAFLSEKGLAPDEAMAASELREAQHAAEMCRISTPNLHCFHAGDGRSVQMGITYL